MAQAPNLDDDTGPSEDEKSLRRKAARTIGRGVWMVGFSAEHPEASREEITAAWAAAREDFTKVGLEALKTLEKAGMKVVEAGDPAKD